MGYRTLGEEILTDYSAVTDFVMGVGTSACAMGTAHVLRSENPEVRVTLVEPDESATLSRGEAGSHTVEGVAVGFKPPHLDDSLSEVVIAIPEAGARRMARRMAAR